MKRKRTCAQHRSVENTPKGANTNKQNKTQELEAHMRETGASDQSNCIVIYI